MVHGHGLIQERNIVTGETGHVLREGVKGASHCAAVLFLSPGGREADSGSIGRGGRRGRSGNLRGVAEPSGADARVRDAGEAV